MTPVHAELLNLSEQHGGLTPVVVLEAATPPDSVLHDRFTWDDTEAAHRFRLQQARSLIRTYKVTVDTADERTVKVRGFTSLPNDEGGRRYLRTDEAMGTVEGRQVVLQQAAREVAALRRKYSALIDFDEVLRTTLQAAEAAA